MKIVRPSIVLDVSSLTGEVCPPPKYKHEGDAAMDCFADLGVETLTLHPGQPELIRLGFKIRVPDGHVLWLLPRSGLGSKQIIIPNAPGTVDRGYSDTVMVCLTNLTEDVFVIHNQDRVCQLVIVELPRIELEIVSELPKVDTSRKGGFGSSGMGGGS